MKIKYLVIPGEVISANDGEKHFIDSRQLMRLYQVNPQECLVLGDCHILAYEKNLIQLRPRYDGNYERPQPSEETHE